MISQEVDLVAGGFNATAAAETISVLETRAPHHRGDLDQFPTSGRTFVDSSNHRVQIEFGKCALLSPSHVKLSACDQPIKAATTRHGSTLKSSIDAALNHRMTSMTDELSSKNVLRHTITGSRKDASVKS